jgi:hypothetical protein
MDRQERVVVEYSDQRVTKQIVGGTLVQSHQRTGLFGIIDRVNSYWVNRHLRCLYDAVLGQMNTINWETWGDDEYLQIDSSS